MKDKGRRLRAIKHRVERLESKHGIGGHLSGPPIPRRNDHNSMRAVIEMARDGARRGLRRAVAVGIITDAQVDPLLDVLYPPEEARS